MYSKHYQPRNVLVTGGAGFIGSNFIRYYLKKMPSIRIINLDGLTYAGCLENCAGVPEDRYTFIRGDVCDATLVSSILQEHEVDTIVHFAAESHVDRSIVGPALFVGTNVMGTFTLLEAARHYWLYEKKWDAQVCRFHHISTDEVFGSLKKNDPAFTEETRYAPNSPYSASKAGSDHFVQAYFVTYGLPTTMSNCSNNYGPYQHPEKFLPTVIRSCFQALPIPVYGDGSNIRDWLYVEDHCRGIAAILEEGQVGESYNIGGNNEMSNLGLALEVCGLMDELFPKAYSHDRLIQFVKDRPGHDWRYAIDSSKMAEIFHWSPIVSLEEGLRKTIQFYCHEPSLAFPMC